MKTHVLTTVKLNDAFNAEIWNQNMINAYYKYCLENFVLLNIYRTNEQITKQQCLDLIGPITAVNEAKQKYALMSEIERQRLLVDTEIFESDEQWSLSPPDMLNNPSDSYNILLSCCSDDKILSRHLFNRLSEEDYLVLLDFSDKTTSNIESKIMQTDLILICFSSNYSNNANCKIALNIIRSSDKKYVPIVFTRSSLNPKDDWLQMIDTEESYYELFREEIRFRINENLNLNYDKLLIELVRIL